MKKRSSYWKEYILSLVFALPVMTIFLLTISVNVHGATLDEFDQYYPMHQNQDANGDSFYTTAILDYIDNYFDSESNYIFSFYSNPHNGQKCFYVYVLSKQADGIFGELKTDIRNFSLYTIGSGHYAHAYGLIISDDGSGPYVWSSTDSVFSSLGYSYCVASNFILYTNNNPDTQRVLLLWGDIEEDPDGTLGHATHPHFDGLHPHYGNTVNPPSEVPPTYTINNYSWTTYNSPSIDTSSVESLLESLIYVINYLAGWLSSNLSGEFSNLIDNLEGFFSYIGQTLQYYGDLIIDNIQNGIQNLYDNFKSVLEPVGVIAATIVGLGTDPDTGLFSVPYLTQVLLVPSTTNVVDLIIANDEFDLIDTGKVLMSSVPSIIGQLINVSPTPTIHVPSCIYHGQEIGDYDISFSWYAPYKIYIDILLNGFLIIGYIYWLFYSFSSHMRGVFLPDHESDDYKRNNIGF